MAINQDDRNRWHAGAPSAVHHDHDRTEFSAKPGRNGHAQIGAFGLYAPLLLRNGYSPDPIEPGAKRPLSAIGDWNRLRTTPLTRDEIAAIDAVHPNAGLGVVGGYGGLVPIDIDTDNMNIRKRSTPSCVARSSPSGAGAAPPSLAAIRQDLLSHASSRWPMAP